MKDFHQFREEVKEAYSINRIRGGVRSGGGITSGGGDGHSDGQSDSGVADRKGQDKDYRHLGDVYDFEDMKIYRELIDLYGYKKQVAAKTVMRNNPDIKRMDPNGRITYR